MSCPVSILHSGVSLSPLSLFTLLTSITTHTHVHQLDFSVENHTFSLDFLPSVAVFTPEELADCTRKPNSFCHFEGANSDEFRAWLTVCDAEQIEMFLHANLASFTLKHENGTFSLDSDGENDCDVLRKHRNKRGEWDSPTFLYNQSLPAYYEKFAHLFSRKRFVEFAMFAEYSVYDKYNKDETKTKTRMLSVLHLANSYYDSLNIEIRLVHLDIFKSKGTINFSSKDKVMESFVKYMEKNCRDIHFDNAALLIAADVQKPPTDEKPAGVGYGELGSICTQQNTFQSRSWVQDNREMNLAAHVAKTLAHELGHNLGISHDREGDYPYCECPMKGCIMNTGAEFNAQFWSNCSLAYLNRTYMTGFDYCLWNEPGKTIDTPSCGNGVVEEGEDCDCGPFGCITHNCCNNNTCKFKENAKCASGACCDLKTCSALKSHQICRSKKTTCDLDEHCDGVNIDCPPDLYLADGERCPEDKESICHGGRCGSRMLQCKEIWGDKAKPGEESCYKKNLHENGCMLNTDESDKKCKPEDILCGKLHCNHPNRLAVPVLTGFQYTYSHRTCFGIDVTYQSGFKPDYYMGMTPDGTNCGDGKFCLNNQCVSKKELLRESVTCSECEGICTNIGCLCGGEKGGDLCLALSQGSSPVYSPSGGQKALGAFFIFLVFIAMWAVIFIIFSIYFRVKRKENFPKLLLAKTKGMCSKNNENNENNEAPEAQPLNKENE